MDILNLLAKANAFHKGRHFVYTSGEHGDAYINLRVLLAEKNSAVLSELSLQLMMTVAQKALDATNPVVVVGPETIGAVIAEAAVTRHNSEFGTRFHHRKLAAVKHEDGSKSYVWDGDEASRLAQLVYVDDLMNAGSTFERCRPIVETYGKLSAAAVFADRSGMTDDELGVPFFSLVKVQLDRYPEDKCPLCRKKVPIVTNLGHGKKFRELHPDYAGGCMEL